MATALRLQAHSTPFLALLSSQPTRYHLRRSAGATPLRSSIFPIAHVSFRLSAAAYSDTSAAAPTDLAGEEIKLGESEIGGCEDSGRGGGSGGSGGRGDGRQEGEGDDRDAVKKEMGGMSMSQKLTLGYAALVGVGGVMGFLKSGSQKSLAAGGLSALLLYYVHSQLPTRPVFASSLGLGLSAALLAVMGSRFKRSGKIFPAGVVSLMSLIMAGGYVHGILRSLHA